MFSRGEEDHKQSRSGIVQSQGQTPKRHGLDALGLSPAEIARHVGVTTSIVARAVAHLEEEERPEEGRPSG